MCTVLCVYKCQLIMNDNIKVSFVIHDRCIHYVRYNNNSKQFHSAYILENSSSEPQQTKSFGILINVVMQKSSLELKVMEEKQFQTNVSIYLRKLAIFSENLIIPGDWFHIVAEKTHLPILGLVLGTIRCLETDDLRVLKILEKYSRLTKYVGF